MARRITTEPTREKILEALKNDPGFLTSILEAIRKFDEKPAKKKVKKTATRKYTPRKRKTKTENTNIDTENLEIIKPVEEKPKERIKTDGNQQARPEPIKLGKRKNRFTNPDGFYEEFDKKVKYSVSRRRPKFKYVEVTCSTCDSKIKVHPMFQEYNNRCSKCLKG